MTFKNRSNKFGAKRTKVNGISFHSKKEAERYIVLKSMLQQGKIKNLELQPRVPLMVNGQKIGYYVGDFRYTTDDGRVVLEDVKSPATVTPIYKLKKKILEAQIPPIIITEFM